MPMHPVTVRRWEVAVAFVAITVAFVLGLLKVTEAQRDADSANRKTDIALAAHCQHDEAVIQAERDAFAAILASMVVHHTISTNQASIILERLTVGISHGARVRCR